MTMRMPLIDAENPLQVARTFDPAKRYRYTWPGQPARDVSGEELATLCKGADPDKLAIEEIGSTAKEIAPPSTFSTRPGMGDGK